MLHRAAELGLALQAFVELVAVGVVLELLLEMDRLERDAAADAAVPRQPHLADGALAEEGLDDVFAVLLPFRLFLHFRLEYAKFPEEDPMRLALLLWLLFAVTARAAEPMCGTSPENDLRVRGIHERTRARISSLATESTRTATLREGAFYLQNDDTITPGYRPFDLAGQSLVFTRSGDAAYTMRREPLQYVEPFNQPVRNFQNETGPVWHYMGLDLPFAFPLFGQSVSRIFITAFNSIHIYTPGEQKGTHFDAIEAAVHRTPVLSPLMITTGKPSYLDYPRVYIDSQPDAVIITWRSTGNAPFGYDIQAKLASDGTVTYSYRSVVGMRWGTPVLSPGFDPQHVSRTALNAVQDNADDVTTSVPARLRPMLDMRRVDVERLADSDLFAIRITLAGPIDRTQLADGQVLGYEATIGGEEGCAANRRLISEDLSFRELRGIDRAGKGDPDREQMESHGRWTATRRVSSIGRSGAGTEVVTSSA